MITCACCTPQQERGHRAKWGQTLFSATQENSVWLLVVFVFLFVLFLRRLLLLGGRAFCLFYLEFAAKQFDDRHVCAIALAIAQFDNSAVAALAISELG